MRALLVVAALARVASADDDEPTVTRAGEANLASKSLRQGVQLSGVIGGALSIGFSMPDANGTGGAVSLRIGEPMTPSWVLNLELLGGGQLHRTTGTMNTDPVIDNDTNALIGAQYYPSESFFIRAGVGVGTYKQTKAARDLHDHKYVGPAIAVGLGLRVKHLIFDFELFSTSMLNREGLLATTAFGLGATIH